MCHRLLPLGPVLLPLPQRLLLLFFLQLPRQPVVAKIVAKLLVLLIVALLGVARLRIPSQARSVHCQNLDSEVCTLCGHAMDLCFPVPPVTAPIASTDLFDNAGCITHQSGSSSESSPASASASTAHRPPQPVCWLADVAAAAAAATWSMRSGWVKPRLPIVFCSLLLQRLHPVSFLFDAVCYHQASAADTDTDTDTEDSPCTHARTPGPAASMAVPPGDLECGLCSWQLSN